MEFDYVIVGAGSAGCVLADRLSQDPSISVCLLEAGKPDKTPRIHAPAGVVTLLTTTDYNWAFQSVPQKGLNGRRSYQPRGKTLGGSSSINGMVYVRGHRWDYDHWASLGNAGWSYDDVLPYFRRAESNECFKDDYHGQGGPLNVANLLEPSALSLAFVEAAGQCGLRHNPDYNGATQEGAFLYQVTQVNGERCSAAKRYLTPNLARPNLKVVTGALSEKVLIKDGRAVGVRYQVGGRSVEVRARGEVIVSCGAFGSPHLLMLSGIGPAAHLREHGIEVMRDLPGVGGNLQDHVDYVFTYRTRSNTDTFGISVRGCSRVAAGIVEWAHKRTGVVTSNFAEAGAFMRSSPELEPPDLQLVFVPGIVDDHARKLHLGHGFSCHVTVLRPASTGTVTLGGADPRLPPVIDPRLLERDEDAELIVKGANMMRRILDAPALTPYRGRALYEVNQSDQAAVLADIRARADTEYHPGCTCAMGSDAMAVVDAQLRVHGVGALRVVDASVMPKMIGGNTNAPTIMIAEKAADLINAGRRPPMAASTRIAVDEALSMAMGGTRAINNQGSVPCKN